LDRIPELPTNHNLAPNGISLALYARIVANITDALLVTEAEPVDAPGPRILYANPAFERMTGYSAAEIIGQTPRVLQGPKTDRKALDRIRTALLKQEPAQVELIHYRKDGTEFEVEFESIPLQDANGKVTHMISIQRDITARNALERQRRETQSRFDRLAATSPGLLCSFRLRPDGTSCFPYVGPRMPEIYGLKPEEVREDASAVFARMHPDDLAHVQATIALSAETMTPWRAEYRVLHPERGTLWVEGHSIPVREIDGSIEWHGIIMDITERKQAEQALWEQQEHLRIAIAAARLGFWERDMQTGTILWSGHSDKLFGMQPGEFDGTSESFYHRIHPDDLAGLLEAREAARRSRSDYAQIFRVVWPDGTIHWLSGVGHFLYDEAGEATRMAGALIDVTERQRLEAEQQRLLAAEENHGVTLAAARYVALDILLNRTGTEALKHIAEAGPCALCRSGGD